MNNNINITIYWQQIITDMSIKHIPKENFNHQDLLYIKQNTQHICLNLKKSV